MAQLQGERLRKLRDDASYTQEELAEKLRVHPRQIHRYESGATDPNGEIVARIAKVFGVTTDYLLGLTDDPLGRIDESDLSPLERRLIAAFRRGELSEALDIAAELAKSKR